MSRLVAFGCSHVYGHGLPDCHIPPNLPGLKHSDLAWPSILAQKLNRECVNLSSPGIGNLAILMRVLTTEFQPDDLVIIGFSYFDRYNCHMFTDEQGNFTLINRGTSDHEKLIKADLELENSEIRDYWYNWLTIHHIESFLKSKNIQHYYYLGVLSGSEKEKPDLLILDNFWNDLGLIVKDYANDGRHQGLESHRLQSELIYNKIKEYELR
jgi:hypothetical protein